MHADKGSAVSSGSPPATDRLPPGPRPSGHWPSLQHLLSEKQSVDTGLNKHHHPHPHTSKCGGVWMKLVNCISINALDVIWDYSFGEMGKVTWDFPKVLFLIIVFLFTMISIEKSNYKRWVLPPSLGFWWTHCITDFPQNPSKSNLSGPIEIQSV